METWQEWFIVQIDKYNQQKEIAINAEANKINTECLNDVYEELEKRNEKLVDKVDIDWLIENLSRFRVQNTFENLNVAKDLINDFQKLGITVPKFINNCFEEVNARDRYLNKLIDYKSYNWSNEKILEYESVLIEETNPTILDKESQLEILNTFYKDGKKLIREINEQIESKYSVRLNTFYSNLTFIASKEDVNYLFWCGGSNSFFNLFSTLNKYIDTKNKLLIIENRIATIKSVNDKQPASSKSLNIGAVEKNKGKTFIEYFNPSNSKREQLAESLKNEFNIEIGKSIKILISLLEEKKLILLKERDFKGFYESMKKYFDREIGSYTSINDFKYNENIHKKDLDYIKIKLENVINEHNIQENSLF